MKKRILSILLCLCMALALLPTAALAATYNSWAEATADGVTLTEGTDTVTIDGIPYAYKGDASTSGIQTYASGGSTKALTEACCWKAGDGYVLYKPTVETFTAQNPYQDYFTGTYTTSAEVTLHNAEISTANAFALSLPYTAPSSTAYPVPVTVKVEGTNSLTTTDANYYALSHDAGDTTFTGGGTLSITGSLWHKNAVTIQSGVQVTVSSSAIKQIDGNLTVTGSGTKLTIAGDTTLIIGTTGGSPTATATVTVKDGAVLENNGTLCMAERTKNDPGITGAISGGVIEFSGGSLYCRLVDGEFIAYGGDVGTSGLDLSASAPAETTRYKAGSGYISYTPATTDPAANAKLELHGAGISTTNATALTLPSDAPVYIIVVSDSSLTAGGSGNVINTNGQALSVTGSGDLTLAGPYYGINVNGIGAVNIGTTGDLTFDTVSQPINTSGDITVSARSITTKSGYNIYSAGAVSFTATDGDISLTTKNSFNGAVQGQSVSLTANKGAVTIHHSDNAEGGYALNGTAVTVSALNDVTITTSRGGIYASSGAVSVTSQSGSIQMDCAMDQCVSADGVVTLSAAAGDITLNDSSTSSTAVRASGQTVNLSAGGTLSSTSAYGFQVGALTVKANEVSIAGTVQDGIQATSVSITNPKGGNCKRVSITATSSSNSWAAIHALGTAATGNITVKADELFICGKDSAKAIIALGTVSIGDAGMIVGAIGVSDKSGIDSDIVCAANGGDKSGGLNLSTAPNEATVYTAGNGYALFTPASGATPAKVTLHSASINNVSGSALSLPNGINTTIVVEGANSLQASQYAISNTNGNITIQGNGTLSASGNDGGLFAKQITVTGSARVTVNGIDNRAKDEPSVTVSGSAVLTSTKGIFTGSYVQSGSASVSANGQSSPGISAKGGIRIDGGSLNAKSDSIALMSGGDITLGSGRAILTPSGGKIASAEFTNEGVTQTVTSVIPAGAAAFTFEKVGQTLNTNGAKEVVIGTPPVTPSFGDAGSSSSSTVTVPVTGGSGSTSVSASVSGGTATVSVSDAQLKEITSGSETSGTVKIDLSGLKADTAVIPTKLVSAANTAVGSTGIEVALLTGTVTLDKSALEAVSGKGDIKLSVKTVDNSKLTEAQKSALGNQSSTALVVDVNVFVNGTQTSTFGDGKISVSVPYTLKSGESADSITVWFVKDDGTIEPKNAVYSNGKVTFTTEHLSQYLIVSFPFGDVSEDEWYYGSVAYAYNNGLFAGTSATSFSPDTAITREMIWMVLSRMDGYAPADMDAARAWAMENAISDGTNPRGAITREQMAAILYRYAQYKGYDTTQGGMAIREFTDYDSISEYALTALDWSVNAGLMQGSDNNLMPAGSATRAQVATILQRFCQNVVK